MFFEFDSILAWFVLGIAIVIIGGGFIFDNVRQKIIAQRKEEARREEEKKEKERKKLQNDLGDDALADLRKAASENKLADVLSSGVKSTEVHGPYISSEINYEKENAPYTIIVYMTDINISNKRHIIFQLDINLTEALDRQVRVLYGPYHKHKEDFFSVGFFYNLLDDLHETVRTYRHFCRSARFVRGFNITGLP